MSQKLDAVLAALADPTRRGVVDLLCQHPRPAGELAAALEMSNPAMSRHLRILRQRGLVDEDRDPDDARVRVYRLKPEPLADLRAWLHEVEEFWGEQLGAFKRHVEEHRKNRDR